MTRRNPCNVKGEEYFSRGNKSNCPGLGLGWEFEAKGGE